MFFSKSLIFKYILKKWKSLKFDKRISQIIWKSKFLANSIDEIEFFLNTFEIEIHKLHITSPPPRSPFPFFVAD